MRINSLTEAKSKGLIEVLDDDAPFVVRPGDLVAINGTVKKVVDTFSRREDTWDDEPEWFTPMVRLDDGTVQPECCCRRVRFLLDNIGEDSVEVDMLVSSTSDRHLRKELTRMDTGKPVADPLLQLERAAADGDLDPSVHFYTRVVLDEGAIVNRVVMTGHSYKTRPHIAAWAEGLFIV